ncbi:hypothetical protein OUZ56_015512 [Daphnia magna]|uniref:Uncharacterized protein n=1 Tax=Daphnia magna TaxID=35525 RepID=A0ABR0AN14_9CRUS|nr:hypothetical protein OUZ56_015512 [Daphnia magna]
MTGVDLASTTGTSGAATAGSRDSFASISSLGVFMIFSIVTQDFLGGRGSQSDSQEANNQHLAREQTRSQNSSQSTATFQIWKIQFRFSRERRGSRHTLATVKYGIRKTLVEAPFQMSNAKFERSLSVDILSDSGNSAGDHRIKYERNAFQMSELLERQSKE